MQRVRIVAAVAAPWLVVVAVAGGSPQSAAARCREVPRLAGLTLAKARRLAAGSGCRVRVIGAQILGPYGEHVRVSVSEDRRRIARQAPRPGGRGPSIDVWLVPECAEMGAPGPPPGEPFHRSGRTELISGLYVAGGPFEIFPGRCRKGVPGAGAITVTEPTAGTPAARAIVAKGQLAMIALGSGTYTIDGTFADATINGTPITASASVTIPPHETVRLDLVASVP